MDLLAKIGFPGSCAVIPHYDNAEGGTHDTRFCYLGERRLAMMEAMLPDDAWVLGVDEHTAVIMDLDARTVTVSGRGGLTVRRRGTSRTFGAHRRAPRTGHAAAMRRTWLRPRTMPRRSVRRCWRKRAGSSRRSAP